MLLAVIGKFKQLQGTILFVPWVGMHKKLCISWPKMFAPKLIVGSDHKNLEGLGTQ